MASQKIVEAGATKEAEDTVLLDGLSFVSEWPLELAESLLDDTTPWWGSWPGDPKDKPNRGPDFAKLANCVYGYCRYPKRVHLLKVPPFFTYPTQMLLDALFFVFRSENFGYGLIRRNEPDMRQALQEVVQRVHSEHPPRFLAVTRLRYWLMHGDTRLGVLTPSASRGGVLSCHFGADPAFVPIHSLFEEAYSQMEEPRMWWDWDTSHQGVVALGLTLLREDGMRMGLNGLYIHETEASFYLSEEGFMWSQQARSAARERTKRNK